MVTISKSTLIFQLLLSLGIVNAKLIVLSLSFDPWIVLGVHMLVTLLRILKLLQGDVLGNSEIALVIWVQDSRHEEGVDLGLNHVFLSDFFGETPILLLQLVVLGQFGLDQFLLPPRGLLVFFYLFFGPSSFGRFLHKVNTGAITNYTVTIEMALVNCWKWAPARRPTYHSQPSKL